MNRTPQDRSADGVPEVEQANTPAEARTGMSDRVAAALNELAALRTTVDVAWNLHDDRDDFRTHIERIDAILRGTDA